MLVRIAIAVICLIVAGIFSGAETALVLLSRKGSKQPSRLLSFWLARPERFLTTALIGTNIFVLAASSVSAYIFIRYCPSCNKLLPIVITSISALYLSDTIPKSIALFHPERFARFTEGILYWFHLLLYPVVIGASGITKLLRKLFNPKVTASPLSIDELHTLVRKHLQGVSEKKISTLDRIFSLARLKAADIMETEYPSTSVLTPPQKVQELAIKSNSEHILVTEETGEPLGYISVVDLVAHSRKGIRELTRTAVTTDRETRLLTLLVTLHREKKEIAFIRGKDNKLQGIVTKKKVLSLCLP
ncbi:DUF21 domain-containing protein [bacterium]|nr:DUF21 domain-containing protein [bacterium]